MAGSPQQPTDPVGSVSPPPPPPPDWCVECILPDGNHIITTVLNCEALGGTQFGSPFPCDQAEARRQQMASRQQSRS
jgi:hypothetical protein